VLYRCCIGAGAYYLGSSPPWWASFPAVVGFRHTCGQSIPLHRRCPRFSIVFSTMHRPRGSRFNPTHVRWPPARQPPDSPRPLQFSWRLGFPTRTMFPRGGARGHSCAPALLRQATRHPAVAWRSPSPRFSRDPGLPSLCALGHSCAPVHHHTLGMPR
jgi:hypothetical protein